MHSASDIFAKLVQAKSISDLDTFVRGTELAAVPVRHHPLGFRVVRVDYEQGYSVRIHSWPNLSQDRQFSFETHNHSFDLTSFVFHGKVAQSIYAPKADPNGVHRMYDVLYKEGRSILRATDHRLTLDKIEEKEICAGSTYHLSAGLFHELEPLVVPAMTIVLTKERGVHPITIGPEDADSIIVSNRSAIKSSSVEATTIGSLGLEEAMFN